MPRAKSVCTLLNRGSVISTGLLIVFCGVVQRGGMTYGLARRMRDGFVGFTENLHVEAIILC